MKTGAVILLLVAVVGLAAADPVSLGVNLAPVIIEGPGEDNFARPLATGDLDGDGLDELVMGRSYFFDYSDGIDNGVYILKGRADFLDLGLVDLKTVSPELIVTGADPNELLGSSVAIGNINGDGFNDLILAAPGATANGREAAGMVYVIFGRADLLSEGAIDFNTPGSWDLRIYGAAAFDDTGGSLAFGGGDAEALAVGDLNGDIYGDLVIGAHLAGPSGGAGPYGQAYVIFGENFTSGTSYDMLSSGTRGYDIRIIGRGEGDNLGEVVMIGDISGDGMDELIIPNASFSGIASLATEGRVHIFKGRASWPTQFDLRSTSADITISGVGRYDEVGEVATLGDFNGDDTLDLAVGVPGEELGDDPDINNGDGFVHIYFGGARFDVASAHVDVDRDAGELVVIGYGSDTGAYPLAAVDINLDGRDDLIIPHRDVSFGGLFSQGVTDIILGQENFPVSPLRLASAESDYRILGTQGDKAGSWAVGGEFNGVSPEEVVIGATFGNDWEGIVWVMDVVEMDQPLPEGVVIRGR